MTKDEWRALGKERRNALTEEERRYGSTAITRAILDDPRWQRAQTVLLFLSFGSEWSTHDLIEAAWAQGKTVALPLCQAEHRITPCLYTEDTPLVTSLGQMLEIAPQAAQPIEVEAIDFCLVPGLLFDPYGTRLGYGAGFYDRFLPTLSAGCTVLSAGFDCQLVGETLPKEDTDVPIGEIITPQTHILTRKPFEEKK